MKLKTGDKVIVISGANKGTMYSRETHFFDDRHESPLIPKMGIGISTI